MKDGTWKILIVDDEPNNLKLLGQILRDTYKLSFATDGIKALDIARKVSPDLVLLDIMMPDMDGYEVCRQLKKIPQTAKTPVIFVSAMREMEDERLGFEVGGVDYITKPLSAPIVQARVATHLALYDQSLVLEKKVGKRTSQLKQAFEELESYALDSIFRLTRAAEYKDEDTGAHIQRMSKYSAAVAREMGYNEQQVRTILYAAPLHDVGKIGIPDRILTKPGKLDDKEWVIMKQHTVFGARILKDAKADYLKLGETIALTHHEKWDGSGYPNGLAGEKIPESGRIVAIADVFDALSSKRPYKDAFSIEKSFKIIEEGNGCHFDPSVVKAFFNITEEILAIKEKYQDEGTSLFIKLADI